MCFDQVVLILISLVVSTLLAVEVGREVKEGVEIINTGPIQLILPGYLSFTIKNEAQCKGVFRICYPTDLTASVYELDMKYDNVGGSCPQGHCTLGLEPEHNGVFALKGERHDGNFYGLFVDGSTTNCPRHVVDGLSNFTVVNVLSCPVIVDGARLPKEEKTTTTTSEQTSKIGMKWIIVICAGLALLLLIVALTLTYICMKCKKKARQVNSVKHVQRASKPPQPHSKKSPVTTKSIHNSDASSIRTPQSNKYRIDEPVSRIHQSSPMFKSQSVHLSNSVSRED